MSDHTAIAVAIISLAGVALAAIAGVAGALFGSRIAARATTAATAAAQAEAQADRDAAERARFVDRIRELAAGLIGSATRALVEVGAQIAFRQVQPTSSRRDARTQPRCCPATAGDRFGQRHRCSDLSGVAPAGSIAGDGRCP